MATYATERRVYRVREGAYVGGVCAGLANYFELDTIVVRILAVLLAGLTLGIACLVYLALWARLPLEPESGAPYDVMPESAESNAFGCVDCFAGNDAEKAVGIPVLARLAIAAGLMIVFLAVAIGVSPLVPGTQWWQFWPVALLMTGLCFIVIPVPMRFGFAWHALGIVVASVAAAMLPMSLGVVSWETFPYAFSQLWAVVVAAVALLVVGLYRRINAFVIVAAFLIAAFCLMSLLLFPVPGSVETLMINMPDGRSLRIAFLAA